MYSQNNILLDVLKVCKLQKGAEQFMELFNVIELKEQYPVTAHAPNFDC